MDKVVVYNVGLYCRLSLDDGNVGESGSIQTQKIILSKYAKDNNLNIYKIYVDDGYSGLNFNRPAFNEMLNDIESGKINMVITKDLSRLGRDYIQTGYYTEIYFQDHKVRYVALSDGIDTINQNNDIAPFKNILNDMYAKDLSRKVKLAKRSRALDGLFISAQTPFGYIKDPNNKNHLIVDEEAKDIVVKIYKLAKQGLGTYRIAKILNEEGVITPSRYKFLKGDTRFARFNNTIWRTETVKAILTDMVYCGHMENHKCEVSNYKTKKIVRVPDSEHIIVKNTHEAIISEEGFEIVNNMIKSRISPRKYESENLFKSIVYCAHCGNRMVLTHQTRNSNYVSQTYKCHKHNRDIDLCPEPNTILYSELKQVVLMDLKVLAKKINRETFIEDFLKRKKLSNKNSNTDKEITKLKNRKEALYQLIKKVYEDNQKGILDSEMTTRMINDYQKELKEIDNKLIKFNDEKEFNENIEGNLIKLREVVNQVMDFENPTVELIQSLISRIEIGYRRSPRKIKIYYRFIEDSF